MLTVYGGSSGVSVETQPNRAGKTAALLKEVSAIRVRKHELGALGRGVIIEVLTGGLALDFLILYGRVGFYTHAGESSSVCFSAPLGDIIHTSQVFHSGTSIRKDAGFKSMNHGICFTLKRSSERAGRYRHRLGGAQRVRSVVFCFFEEVLLLQHLPYKQ